MMSWQNTQIIMTRFLFLGILTLFWNINSKAQDDFGSLTIKVYESDNEKRLFQQHDDEHFFLLQSLHPNLEEGIKNWNKLVKRLDKKASKKRGEVRFLSDIFYISHQSLLNQYETHANFSNTLAEGIYDCVTGTGLYALLLDRYGIPYYIVETDAHVYLKGNFNGVDFVMESTFPLNGLVIGAKEVADFDQQFFQGPPSMEGFKVPSVLGGMFPSVKHTQVLNRIDIKELAGLQYYNDAILKFNQKAYQEAYAQLVKAAYLYPSPRINHLKEKMETLLEILVFEDLP